MLTILPLCPKTLAETLSPLPVYTLPSKACPVVITDCAPPLCNASLQRFFTSRRWVRHVVGTIKSTFLRGVKPAFNYLIGYFQKFQHRIPPTLPKCRCPTLCTQALNTAFHRYTPACPTPLPPCSLKSALKNFICRICDNNLSALVLRRCNKVCLQ